MRQSCSGAARPQRLYYRSRVFFNILLVSGEERLRLLEAMDWDGLQAHMRTIHGTGGAALTIRAGLEAMEAPTLVCLRISDTGTEGLGGNDWDESGHFRRLCIQNFTTADNESVIRIGVTRVSPSEACLPCRSTIALVRGAGKRHRLVDEAGQLLDLLHPDPWRKRE